jgi:hypothetical protein
MIAEQITVNRGSALSYNMPMNKGCKRCSAPIVAVGNANYCDACKSRRCEQCGNTFTVRQQTATALYCGASCYHESLIGKPAHNKGKMLVRLRPCATCGDEMSTSGRPKKLYCSTACFNISQTGSSHPRYRGAGRRRGAFFSSAEYRQWRKAVMVRDGGICRWCDSGSIRTFINLEVHHIIPFGAYPEGAYMESNGITLCRSHHRLTMGRENEYAEFCANLINCALVTSPAPNRKDRKPLQITSDELRHPYIDESLSSGMIGKKLGVTKACILKYLKRFDIPRRRQACVS